MSTYIRVPLYQNIDEYKIKVLEFGIKYYFQVPKHHYQYSVQKILMLQYLEKADVEVLTLFLPALGGFSPYMSRVKYQYFPQFINSSVLFVFQFSSFSQLLKKY